MDKLTLFPPLEFRLSQDDHERFGEGPWTFDELAVCRLPVREQIAIEAVIDMSLERLFVRFAQGFTDAKLAALWVARRMSGIVEEFASFDPLVTLMNMRPAPAGDADPPDQGSASSPSTDPSPPSASSGSRGSPSKRASRRIGSAN